VEAIADTAQWLSPRFTAALVDAGDTHAHHHVVPPPEVSAAIFAVEAAVPCSR